jgi:predicted RND superfamily exporter protein
LTIVLGIFGLGGIGHIYLGNITRGIVILIVGIILLIASAVTFGIGLIILIPFAIWVVFDSRKQCKYYNDHLEQTGRPPW